ncbi:exopolyphosphatase [Malaciobacter marinus]|uniref:Exopolyphosphatase n=1 Tax=Malaciobacter marinus TaxID=505249 RepID=A0A347TKQ5_9BACT|nr:MULTISPECIES: exopolyphosphatase [Malaciobacter]AXX87183.1 exopolyphosphatase, Ppx/GppA family [Malaciobacter marinus]PHO12727.1 exopolyphosphatase [Malaciobacter marinus]PHO14846.1 exopolyphosphatase [Malaciobacter marinus]RYA22537.1 exopolyphosphatase [Malaciobacter halophilus]
MEKVVAIDLGSNSFRVLVYDCLNHKIISEFNQVVGMADGLVDTGVISKEAQERVINTINYSSEKLNYNPKEAICVTTAAMRMANNSKEVLQYFSKETGAKFKIIDGNEEARLTLLAVKYALKREKLKSEKFVLLDIGGGSTEIIVNTKNDYKAHSFNFGIVTLTQKFNDYKLLEDNLNLRKKEIRNFIDTLQIDLEEYTFVATAGTPTTIAAIKLGQDFFHYDKSLVNGTIVDLNDLNECLELFRNSSKQTITSLVGSGRVEFIEVGVYIYKAIFEALNKKESIVLDDGLREGVAINQCLIK